MARAPRTVILAATALMWLAPGPRPGIVAAQPPTPAPSLESAKPLIVMISGRLGEEDTLGAGIVVGSAHDRLYIATANYTWYWRNTDKVMHRGVATVEGREVVLRAERADQDGRLTVEGYRMTGEVREGTRKPVTTVLFRARRVDVR